MTDMTSNKIIAAKKWGDDTEKIKEIFERSTIADKVQFICWYLDNFDYWVPRRVDLADHSVQEISETTGLSQEYINFLNKDVHANDSLTDNLVFRFSQNVPIEQLSKITLIDRKKTERIRGLRSRHPHCLVELLSLYFQVKAITGEESPKEFIKEKRGKKKYAEKASAEEIKKNEDQEAIKEKLAIFIKKKKAEAFNEIENLFEIPHYTLKNIVSAHFSEKCLSNPNCPYKRFLKI